MPREKAPNKIPIYAFLIVFPLTLFFIYIFIHIYDACQPKTQTPDSTETTDITHIEDDTEDPVPAPEEAEPKPSKEPNALQSFVTNWANSNQGTYGIVIYDLDNSITLASHNAERSFRTASIYKLFVVYQGYLDREKGKINGNSILTKNYTWNDCLDLAIRESNSTCAEAIRSKYRNNINQIVQNDWGLKNTDVMNLTSTPLDAFKMIQMYYNHENLSRETWLEIRDSMLNQPPSEGLCDGPCNWRQGFPAGFPKNINANILDKVGWEYNEDDTIALHHDAVIIEYPDKNRNFIVILFSENSRLYNIRSFAKQLAEQLNNML